MSHDCNYYSFYGDLTVTEYVERQILRNAAEMDRISQTVAAIPREAQSVLDVGAGHGIFLRELLKTRPLMATAIETSTEKVAYCRSIGVDARMGDASRLDAADCSYDIVTACEVIEHLPYGVYERALREFERVARNWILISVPYQEQRPFVKCPYCGSVSNPNYHFRSFSDQDLVTLFKSFTLYTCQYVGRVPLTASLLSRFPRPPRARFFLCPACGYRTAPPQGSSTGKSSRSMTGRALSILHALVPTRPIWALALYCRTDDRSSAD